MKKKGIFLLHGITKSSSEFSKIKENLEELGYFVETPNLPRHGSCPREYETCWRDVLELTKDELLKGSEEKFKKFREKFDEVFVGGNSLGANIAFYLAGKYPVNGIIAIGPVYKLNRGLEIILSFESKIGGFLTGNREEDSNGYRYHDFNIDGVLQLVEVAKNAPEYIKDISVPTLLIFSKNDNVASPQNAKYFIKWLKENSEVHLFDNLGHGLPESQDIFLVVQEFLNKCSRRSSNIKR